MDKIFASYPYGTFEIGRGYPLFTSFSRDKNPNVDIAGGINIGLSFRNVVESASGWSCEITCITPTTINGAIFAGDSYTAFAASTTQIQLPVTESEISSVYVGGTLTIGGETRTISAYTPVGVALSPVDHKTPGVATVSTAFSSAPAAGAAYTLVRPDVSCTVDVEPISDVFTMTVAKKTVPIPAANNWILVQFP
jgi:hypothetical protein